jgi:hypothetical protein
VEWVYMEAFGSQKLDLIEEALQRQDDQLHGFADKTQFVDAAFYNRINDPSLEPTIRSEEVRRQVLDFLFANQMFFTDYNHQLRNVPILEVW